MPTTKRIRVSVGTAGVLGLLKLYTNAEPTTAYLMTYTPNSCRANCRFCPQASRSSSSRELLSRVIWPDFPFDIFLERAIPIIQKKKFNRICIQALNYPNFVENVSEIASSILREVRVPVSVSCSPIAPQEMSKLRELGVERIAIPIDAATREIFEKTKGRLANGPYRWDTHFAALRDALEVFGRNKVTTHIIVGLGETERDVAEITQNLFDMGVCCGLFAFTPIKGTELEDLSRPGVSQYRRVQVARHLIILGATSVDLMKFSDDGRISDFGVSEDDLSKYVSDGQAFMTSGCVGCNRPFYTESPRGPIYNYPRALNDEERQRAFDELRMLKD